ncbi:hypothetical protein N9Y67_03185, partial [Pseudomonadota bacterium]|nr:hypothetical protein [Pseudomonadota bacterium]
MKLIKLAVVVSALIWLSACNTLGGLKSDTDTMSGEGVVVEDRSAETSGTDSENTSGTDIDDGVETQVIV